MVKSALNIVFFICALLKISFMIILYHEKVGLGSVYFTIYVNFYAFFYDLTKKEEIKKVLCST